MSKDAKRLPTIGEIARRLNCSVHQIEYLVRSRRIQPTTLAGNARVFSESDVDLIASLLQRIEAERASRGPGGWGCRSRACDG